MGVAAQSGMVNYFLQVPGRAPTDRSADHRNETDCERHTQVVAERHIIQTPPTNAKGTESNAYSVRIPGTPLVILMLASRPSG